ncbi:MAG: hypothetical protein GWN13_09235 [Phycisphaerae bacterium]|nr:hypothetical protein [Phycisphaerae bacterium]
MGYKERIIACFKGLATGDAIGKQSEMLSHAEVLKWYPEGINGFHGQPGDTIPRYVGNRKCEWRIGETTDDTEQTIAVAKAILREGKVSHTAIGEELLHCRKSNHPGVKSMWTFQQIGDPNRIASEGDGCGAAMRVAPVGVLYSCERLDELVKGAYESSIPTHGGQLAICAAAAVAAAISAAIDGKSVGHVLSLAVKAARKAEQYRPPAGSITIAASIQEIYEDLSRLDKVVVNYIAEKYFPDKPVTIVPVAINLALITESAEETILLAANAGGDADSVASIGGGIAGALHPTTVNQDWYNVVERVNENDLISIAEALARLRQ